MISFNKEQLTLDIDSSVPGVFLIYSEGKQVGDITIQETTISLDFTTESPLKFEIKGKIRSSVVGINATHATVSIDLKLEADSVLINANQCLIDHPIELEKLSLCVNSYLETNAIIKAKQINMYSCDRITVNQRIIAEETNILATNLIAINAKLTCLKHNILQAKNIEVVEDVIGAETTVHGNLIRKPLAESAYYIYVPIERKKITAERMKRVEDWVELERQNNKYVKICCYNDKNANFSPCLTDLPNYGKVYVSMHGTDLSVLPIFASVSSATLANHKRTSKFFIHS